jgi:tRNA(Met) C34 N-acetyltransferase TmcA
VRQERRLIGRIHRRRGLSFQVVDVAVVPEHQKEGLGTIAVNTLMS